MADSRVPEVKSGNTNPTTTVPPPEDQRPSLNFACIKASDKNFLPLLGRGTDALNLVEWRKQATVYPGLLVREVKEDFSNIHGYTIGEERTYTVFGTTKSQNRTVSGDITAGGAAAGVPVTASLKTSTSKSKKENLILAEQVIVNRMYAFKVEFPTSFPTAFESDLYKWLAEHLHSFIYTPKDGLNKDYVAGLTEGSEEWLEIEACIEEYIAKNAVTDYVFSIALGVKDMARSHSMKQRKEVSGGGSVGATETATVGVNVQDTITTSENQRERKTIGRVEVEEETGSLSVQKVGVVKAGIGGIGDLVQSAKIRRMVEKKAMEYKIRKRKSVISIQRNMLKGDSRLASSHLVIYVSLFQPATRIRITQYSKEHVSWVCTCRVYGTCTLNAILCIPEGKVQIPYTHRTSDLTIMKLQMKLL